MKAYEMSEEYKKEYPTLDIKKMVINKTKLELTMAELLINPKELAEKAQISYPAFKRAWEGQSVKIATIGKIARALGVPVQDIIE